MNRKFNLYVILPLIAGIAPSIVAAQVSEQLAKPKQDRMLVTAAPNDVTTEAQAGAGFFTSQIDIGPLGNLEWIDTPYSTTTISREIINNQQAKSLSELLKFAPSTQMQARGGMDVGRPQSRGMQGSVVANSRLDDLYIISTTAFPVEMLDRVDIINSLTGALYGPASPAGQFNFTAKRPEDVQRLTLGYQSRNAYSGHGDLGGYFDENKRFGYRLNLLDEESTGSVDDSTLRRKFASLALDWNIQPGTQLQLNASHYNFVQKGYVGSFSYGPKVKLPKAPNPQDKNLALHTAGNDLTTDTVSTRLLHDFNEDWSLKAGVGYQQADRAMRTVTSAIQDNNGTISRSLMDSPASGRFRVLSHSVMLNGHVETGPIAHDLSLATNGYVWSIYSSKENSTRRNLGDTNMYHPSPMEEPSDGKIHTGGSRYKSAENRQQSITIGDTITFDPQWSAMFYLSQSWLESRSFDKQHHKTSQTHHHGLSPQAALMYKISPQVMTYISYADSLEEGDTAPLGQGIKNEGHTLNPYRSKQYELGIKADVADLNLGAALFHLERPFAYVDGNDLFREQGKQVNRGLELSATGHVWQGLNIYSGVTFLDPKLTDTGLISTKDKRVVGVPKVQANMLVEYSLPSVPELVYSANVHYSGKRAANDTNTSWIDSYTTLDLGARYSTKIGLVPTTFRLSVNNVTDKRYWASIFPGGNNGQGGGNSAFVGSGREVRATATFDF
ncbi:TonB-dependent siderophore receptor [Providencia rettgeri]|uniref:TonB-dependent siderophore receptor n=1 Tax=Providencia rettgeri TaxID=587 RepID=A0AAP2JUZ7_PRORE|nr:MULTISPECIES: TonB-dependent siderophore receptor [Providencia]MBQ0208863.1 TonB-dependent siderophore receptor [Providencia rettgeri]MBX6951543.1 TonB-dependent siderophore receptor [Providencia rettgeri]MBX6953906.1 TonB-dependent siderophore receptor [Providencia rettgeri]MBX6959715.1 TonB-dependent siderophore receptor [Providencia rettgeri]MBX6972404.1 TonB-dependent siderophore receptor [Providencia rettgeri]